MLGSRKQWPHAALQSNIQNLKNGSPPVSPPCTFSGRPEPFHFAEMADTSLRQPVTFFSWKSFPSHGELSTNGWEVVGLPWTFAQSVVSALSCVLCPFLAGSFPPAFSQLTHPIPGKQASSFIGLSLPFSLPLSEFFQSLIHTQFSSVTQLCPTLWEPMNCSTPGLTVHHQLPEFTETHVHRVGDAIQPSHPLSSPSPPTLNPSQHQGLFQ